MQINITDGDFLIDAGLLAELLGVAASEIPTLMQARAITSACERGTDEHSGRYRLSFFYRSRRARLNVDASGTVLNRSTIDFGDEPLPRTLHRAGR
jgi:hypothetical protein